MIWIIWRSLAKGAITLSTATFVRSIDPVTGEFARLYHPRQDRWQDHFAWSDDYALLVGLTMVGRAMIERLQLNREGVVNLRRLLCAVDRHRVRVTF